MELELKATFTQNLTRALILRSWCIGPIKTPKKSTNKVKVKSTQLKILEHKLEDCVR